MKKVRVALIQNMPDGRDVLQTANRAVAMIGNAAENGAELAALPEMFYAPYIMNMIRDIAGDNRTILDLFSRTARELGIIICTGSMATRHGDKVFNETYLIDTGGAIIGSYAKTHLFDVSLDTLSITESSLFSPGEHTTVVNTAIGTIGLEICYDIRFPELSRKLTLDGAEILIVPAVFNHVTGPAHWHLFMRTRAVENQVFLCAVSQARNANCAYKAYGHSLIVNPWGDILAEAGEEEEILYADLDPAMLEETRRRLPLLQQRRPQLYRV